MEDYIDLALLGDLLALGGAGFFAGVAFPLAFRLIGYVVDSVLLVVKG